MKLVDKRKPASERNDDSIAGKTTFSENPHNNQCRDSHQRALIKGQSQNINTLEDEQQSKENEKDSVRQATKDPTQFQPPAVVLIPRQRNGTCLIEQ